MNMGECIHDERLMGLIADLSEYISLYTVLKSEAEQYWDCCSQDGYQLPDRAVQAGYGIVHSAERLLDYVRKPEPVSELEPEFTPTLTDEDDIPF